QGCSGDRRHTQNDYGCSKVSDDNIITLLVRCKVKPPNSVRARPIQARNRFNLVIRGSYFPSSVQSVQGGKLSPGETAELTLRAIVTTGWTDLKRGEQLEL